MLESYNRVAAAIFLTFGVLIFAGAIMWGAERYFDHLAEEAAHAKAEAERKRRETILPVTDVEDLAEGGLRQEVISLGMPQPLFDQSRYTLIPVQHSDLAVSEPIGRLEGASRSFRRPNPRRGIVNFVIRDSQALNERLLFDGRGIIQTYSSYCKTKPADQTYQCTAEGYVYFQTMAAPYPPGAPIPVDAYATSWLHDSVSGKTRKLGISDGVIERVQYEPKTDQFFVRVMVDHDRDRLIESDQDRALIYAYQPQTGEMTMLVSDATLNRAQQLLEGSSGP